MFSSHITTYHLRHIKCISLNLHQNLQKLKKKIKNEKANDIKSTAEISYINWFFISFFR